MNSIVSRQVSERTARVLPLVVDRLQRLNQGMNDNLGLSAVQLQMLDYIHSNGPSPIATLTRALRRAQSSVSELTDRLESKGYVKRAVCEDRRKALVSLTATGRKWMRNRDGARRTALGEVFTDLRASEQQDLLEHLLAVLSLTDRVSRRNSPRPPARSPGILLRSEIQSAPRSRTHL